MFKKLKILFFITLFYYVLKLVPTERDSSLGPGGIKRSLNIFNSPIHLFAFTFKATPPDRTILFIFVSMAFFTQVVNSSVNFCNPNAILSNL